MFKYPIGTILLLKEDQTVIKTEVKHRLRKVIEHLHHMEKYTLLYIESKYEGTHTINFVEHPSIYLDVSGKLARLFYL